MYQSTLDLAAIKVGDQVAWMNYSGPRTTANLGRVTRLTPSQIIVAGPFGTVARFRRKDGREIDAGGWAYVLAPDDPNVIRVRALWTARHALDDIATMARTADTGDTDSATRALEEIRDHVNYRLDRMAQILTGQPISEENES